MNETHRAVQRPLSSHRRLLAVLGGATLLIAACGTGGTSPSAEAPTDGGSAPTSDPARSPASDLSGTITIDGSSTVYLITAAVAEEFQKANPNVQVPVSFAGTGGGFKKFCAGETDANDASRPIKADDEGEGLACTANGIEPVELKIAYDGLSVVVPSSNTWADCLTVQELKAIFGPESTDTTTWADIRAGWPAEAIGRYQPGVDSGTFDYFTEEINGEVDASTQAGTFSEDDNQLVQGVAGDPNGIGYFGYAYYAENTDKLKAVPVDGGAGCVAPSPETVRDGTYTPLSRPLFVYPSKQALARPEVKAFFDYYLANVSTLAPSVGYVDLPAAELQATVDALAAAAGN